MAPCRLAQGPTMRTETPPQIRLKDYRPSNYLIDTVHLDVTLDPTRTRVLSRLQMRPNPQTKGKHGRGQHQRQRLGAWH